MTITIDHFKPIDATNLGFANSRGRVYVYSVLYDAELELSNPSDATATGSISLSFPQEPAPVPSLGPLGMALLAGLLGAASWRRLRR